MDRTQADDGVMQIDVVLADRDPLARGVVGRSLADAGGFTVVGETASGRDAVDLCAQLRPTIAVLEINLRDIDGVEATRRIRHAAPDVHVLILSVGRIEEFWLDALNGGARGIVAKETPMADTIEAMRRVARGEHVVPPGITALLIERVRAIPTLHRRLRPVDSKLTEREWEVVALLRDGASTAGIATELHLSDETVYTHLKNVMRKLGVHSRTEIVAAADALLSRKLVGG